MKQPVPAITVLMPAFNAAAFIAEAIRSVLAQDFSDFELLIVDDGSTDDTAAIVQGFSDRRIRLVDQPHRGIAAALNRGLYEARSPLIARFDADDICFPTRLRLQHEFLKQNPDVV